MINYNIPKVYGGNWFTDQAIANALINIEKYDWAKKQRDEAVKAADECVAKGAEFYWAAIASHKIPRTIHTNFLSECPVCGKEMTMKYGSYSWICHTQNNSWEIECPNCHIVLPSNDFKSYYESGLDDKGFFEPDAADPKFLVNVKYPEKGKDWLVDDGFGWTSETKDMWAFAAYYHHYGLWFKSSDKNGAIILNAIDYLTKAFLFTQDMKYADLGLVILDRMADIYPDMHLCEFKDWKPYYNSCGGRRKGKIIGSIWEYAIANTALRAVDAFVPVIHRSDAVNILNSIYKKRNLSLTKESNNALSEHLFNNIVRQVYEGVKSFEICGNTGMHQSALALAAVVAGKSAESDEWVDWIFRTDERGRNREVSIGGNILALLHDQVSRDGFGDEASPSYNSIWLTCLMKIAKILKRYPGLDDMYDLFKHPRFIKMAYSYIPIPINAEYMPAIGDTGACGNPGTKGIVNWLADSYAHYKSPELAYAAWLANGKTVKGLFTDIFDKDPEQLEKEMEDSALKGNDPYKYGTSLPAYGYSVLYMNADNADYRARPCLYMYFGSNTGHGHYDTLNIGYYNYRINLMPDLGYPEFATTYPRRSEWTHNVISHNTVAVDNDQSGHKGGWLKGYSSGEKAGYICASGLPAYPDLKRYDRSCALISCDNGSSYIIDRFVVEGGQKHYYSLHGAKGKANVLNNQTVIQKNGSYAGEEVEYGIAPDVDYSLPYRGYKGIGLHYLKDVRRIAPENLPVKVRWNIEDHWNVYEGNAPDVKLDIELLSEADKMDLATGIPPRNKPGTIKELDYIIAFKNSDNSEFVSCITSYTGDEYIEKTEKITAVPLNKSTEKTGVCAVKVVHKDKTVDYILFSDGYDREYLVEDKIILSGKFAIYREKNGVCVYAHNEGGKTIGKKDDLIINNSYAVISGIVTDFEKNMVPDCYITLDTSGKEYELMLSDKHHRYVYVERGDGSITAYRIFGYEYKNGALVLNIGNNSPINGLYNRMLTDGGYKYEIENGMKASIPCRNEYIG